MYLLDTNVVSEFRRTRPHGGVVAWTKSVEADGLHIAAVTVGEIQRGTEKTRMTDPDRAAELESWLLEVVNIYNTIPADGPIFRAWARLTHGKSNDLARDALIAATASVRGLTVVSRNQGDFAQLGVQCIDPFTYRA